MAYTTSEEIESDFKDIDFDASGVNVSADDVTQFIVEHDALIDAYVGKVYVTPVTTGEGLNLLKLLSRSLTTLRVKKIMEVKQATAVEVNQNVVSVLLSPTQVMAILKDIQSGKLALAGATLLLSGNGFFNKNVSDSVEPVIKKDQKQW